MTKGYSEQTAGAKLCIDLALSLIHISEPTRQAEISYAVFCLKKKVGRVGPDKIACSTVILKCAK